MEYPYWSCLLGTVGASMLASATVKLMPGRHGSYYKECVLVYWSAVELKIGPAGKEYDVPVCITPFHKVITH